MPDVHAKLSASGAHRWMACTPSANLEAQFPDKGSEYAEEGTFAHSMAELILRYNNNEISKKDFSRRLNEIKDDPYYSKEMEEYISDYANRVWEMFNEAKASCLDAVIYFEQRLSLSEYVPEGFGTCDVVIIADGLLQVIDLKYGKGVGISAEGNPQTRLYGIGAYLEYSMLYDIRRVRMTIIQPRLESISTEELAAEELLAWAEDTVKPLAQKAAAGEGDFCVGEHCRFCKARATCRAREEHNLELAKLEFKKPELLEDSEIGTVLRQADKLAAWVKDVTDWAFDQALNHGKKWDGWKLVEGTSRRKYADQMKAMEALKEAGYREEQILKEPELIGLTEMTKLVGKKNFDLILKGLVIKPEGKPTLVPDSDKRPELNSAKQAQDDFDDIPEGYDECLKEMTVLEAIPPHYDVGHYLETMGGKFNEACIRRAYEAAVRNELD